MVRTFLCFALAASVASAHDGPPTRREHGFIGYGIEPWEPLCAFGCRDAIAGATLNCSTMMEMPDMPSMAMTDASCYATDDVFLQTLAWCMASRCKDLPAWKLEKFWKTNAPGMNAVQPDPKMTWREALDKIDGAPTAVYTETGSLNKTSIVAEDMWFAAYNTDKVCGEQESMQQKYGFVILFSGVLIPISFSLLRFVPFPGALRSKFNAWIIDPPLFGTRHDTPVLFGLTQVPKRGQALFIFYFIIINIVFSAVNYEWASPNIWYPDNKWRWMVMLVSNRLGLLSFANLPLVFLYAGRNNFLLWVTNWSHSTFLLIHRWIAAIATLQAILHSIIYLHAYIKAGTYTANAKLPYWYWGAVATIGMSILFPASVLPIRKRVYEIFLAWHVAISILIVAGCYWHIVFEYHHSWGYETWIFIVMAIWAFDRVFRFLRLARHGIQQARVTVIDEEYIRIDVPHVTSGGYAYLYFPTLTWRVWENHPFSVASTMLPATVRSRTPERESSDVDIEKHPEVLSSSVAKNSSSDRRRSGSLRESFEAGITFYIRGKTGLTSALRNRTTLPVLLEAGYSAHSASSLHTSPTLIALAGGVGITAVLPALQTHPGRAKLYWGCRTQTFVDNVRSIGVLSRVEQDITVGRRMAVREILESELTGGMTGEVVVLVSGPEGMADEARNVVGEIVRKSTGVRVRLLVESFSW